MSAELPGSKPSYSPQKADLFLRRLRAVDGNVRLAALSLGMTREQINYWIKRYPEFKEAYQKARAEIKG